MNKESIVIPGGSVTLYGFASDHPMQDPYVSGVLHRKETFWKRGVLEDIEKRLMVLQQSLQQEKVTQ